jgi:hypothetical protein
VAPERETCGEHRFGWSVTASVTMHRLTCTVSDKLELTPPAGAVRPHHGRDLGPRRIAMGKNPGYGQLVRWLNREVSLEPAPRPKADQSGQTGGRFSRKAAIPSRAPGSRLAAAMTSIAVV